MKKIYWLAPLGALLAIQFIRPNTTNPSVDPALDFRQVAHPPADVQGILEAACYDCHSDETRYPWYSQVAPVSWFVVNHIREGREKLNFSTYGALSMHDQGEALEEASENIQEGEMPLDSYVWMHPEANLSATQRTTLLNWLNASGGNQEADVPGDAEKNVMEQKTFKDDDED